MQLGMIGLGRMGANMVRRLMRAGHDCVVHDRGPEAIERLEAEGATGAPTMDEFVDKLAVPRAGWKRATRWWTAATRSIETTCGGPRPCAPRGSTTSTSA